jgi:outer membrane immunogenic protein
LEAVFGFVRIWNCCDDYTQKIGISRFGKEAIMKLNIIGGIIGGVALLIAASLSGARAADMPLKASPVPVAPPPSWTGFYIGVQGGGGWASVDQSYVDTSTVFGSASMNGHGSGGLGGALVGYNWQVNPNLVLGLEGDWDWTRINAGMTTALLDQRNGLFAPGGSAVMNTELRDLATIRGRIGYTGDPSWLAYATGGVAFARTDFNGNLSCPVSFAGNGCGAAGVVSPVSFGATRTGFAVGGGLEYKLTANWTAGVEYLFYDFARTESGSTPWLLVGGGPTPYAPGCPVAAAPCVNYSFGNLNVSTVRARLSYKF